MSSKPAPERTSDPAAAPAASRPTFVIGGERRCGTTSLYHWLRAHPDLYLYPKPDMDYFIEDEIARSREWIDGEPDADAWERTHDPETYVAMFGDGGSRSAVGQKDADLLFWRPAHARLARYLPNCRFLFILRNPVDRAWSHYLNEVAKGREALSFEAAVAEEEERSRRSAYARLHLSYVARGFYAESLAAFFEHVSPSRVKVVSLERAKARPRETLSEVFEFLGLEPDRGLALAGTRHNASAALVRRPWARSPLVRPIDRVYTGVTERLITGLTKDAETRRRVRGVTQRLFRRQERPRPMPDAVREQLARRYAPHVAEVERLLGTRFPEWSAARA